MGIGFMVQNFGNFSTYLFFSFSGLRALPIGPIVVPFWSSYVESYKVVPKKELLWGLWVGCAPCVGFGMMFGRLGLHRHGLAMAMYRNHQCRGLNN